MKRTPNLLITMALFCVLTLGCIGQPPPTEPIKYQNPQTYRVVFIVTVYNRGFDVDSLVVCQARPKEWDSQRNVQVEEVSPFPTKEGADPVYGNGIYYWEIEDEPEQGESLPFEIQFTFTAYEIVTHINPDDVQPSNKKDSDYKLYTRSEPFIEADDPLIVDVADEIAAGETNPYLAARKFYDYVIDNAEYRSIGRLIGAKELLTTGKGECGDYSALFVALCRTKGIPARPIVGYWASSGLDQAHVWAEFRIEPFGWIPADPQVGQFSKDREYYFGNIDNERVVLHKGFNIPLDSPAPDNFIAELLQAPYWWFWGHGDGKTMSMKRTSWAVTSLSSSQSDLSQSDLSFLPRNLLKISVRCGEYTTRVEDDLFRTTIPQLMVRRS